MDSQTVTIICSAVPTAIGLVGGFYIRNFIKHQVDAKDATIEHLQVEISTLKGDRAPAIAQDYKAMREHAEQATQDRRKLEEQLKLLSDRQKERDKAGTKTDPRLEQARGLSLAATILMRHINKPVGGIVPNPVFVKGTFDAIHEIVAEVNDRTPNAKALGDAIAAAAKKSAPSADTL